MPTPTSGTHSNLIGLQRAIAVKTAGQEAAQLYQEGYGVDADRILETLHDRIEEWKTDGQG